ncbi:hypothetical protein SO802_034762 [Lithocarpus litseifolius]|uniref:PCI domain-containing protein n=1 Tax=Lithocarpus litseifolius TaxID=425828 RepID=A0AAW2BJD5_9ROSI
MLGSVVAFWWWSESVAGISVADWLLGFRSSWQITVGGGFGGFQWQWVCDCLLRWVEILGLSCGRRLLALDQNLGLVEQVVSSMYKQNIQRLSQTSLILSLEDIANEVQLNNPKTPEMHVL